MATKPPITMMDMAVRYSENGWAVYPLIQGGKIPHKGSNGHLDASNDPEEVKKLFLQYGASSNIGLSLLNTEYIIIDVDLHHEEKSGFDSMQELEDAYQALPDTYTVSTPRNGEHRYYKISGLSLDRDLIDFRPGIDILGTKVNAAPSVTDVGAYRVKSGKITDIAELPKWFIELMVQHDKQNQMGTDFNFIANYKTPPQGKTWKAVFLEEMVGGAGDGNRNSWLTSMFGKLIYSKMDVRKAIQLIGVVNQNFVSPSIKQKELENIINSVLKREISKTKGGVET